MHAARLTVAAPARRATGAQARLGDASHRALVEQLLASVAPERAKPLAPVDAAHRERTTRGVQPQQVELRRFPAGGVEDAHRRAGSHVGDDGRVAVAAIPCGE